LIHQIPAWAAQMVDQEARTVPVQDCRFWVLNLLLRIERRHLILSGTYDFWKTTCSIQSSEDLGPGDL
jgi:hypothetical protein